MYSNRLFPATKAWTSVGFVRYFTRYGMSLELFGPVACRAQQIGYDSTAEEATRVAGTDGKESNGGDGRDKLKVGISSHWAEWMILVSDDWELPFSARQPAPAPAVAPNRSRR